MEDSNRITVSRRSLEKLRVLVMDLGNHSTLYGYGGDTSESLKRRYERWWNEAYEILDIVTGRKKE